MKFETHSDDPILRRLPWLAAAVLAAALALPLLAQVPADAVLSGFQPDGDYLFELDGNDLPHAELYHSDRAVAYLIMAPELPAPILVNLRSRAVESVHLMKVVKRGDGSVDLLADATLQPLGQFNIDGQEVVFTIDGKPAKLKRKPSLVGPQTADELRSYDPGYGRGAEQYGPSEEALDRLRAQSKDVVVRVFFGSWCSVCKRYVPNLMRIDDELAGSKVHFDYYGLPRDFSSDPEASRFDVKGVPTAIVFVNGKEVGRLSGNDYRRPETAINRLLGQS